MTAEEQKHQKDLERLRRLRPIDDDFMRCLFKDNIPLVQLVLRIIMEKPDLVITECETQKDMKRLGGARSVCLDAFGWDTEGQEYDVEVEREDKDADPHRARYYSSVVDVESLDARQKFKELPNTFIIFITEKDYFKQGEPVYFIERMNITTGKPFGDGAHILYVNGAYRGDSDIGKLMHDFCCTDAADMNFELMAERTRYLKENPKGVNEMCKVIEEMRLEEREEGRMEGRLEGIKEGREIGRREGMEKGMEKGRREGMEKGIKAMALRMLEAGKYALGEIAAISGLSLDEVKELQTGQAAPGV